MSGAGSLTAFEDDLAAWAMPSLAAPHIVAGLQAETSRLLLQGPTGHRAQRLLAIQFGALDPASLDPVDISLLTGDAARLETIGAQAGCVWHGARVRALLRGAEIAALVGRFGEVARAAALRHAPPLASAPATDDLAADIAADATRCIEAWVEHLPPAARSRLRLVRPAAETRSDHAELRAALIRRLAAEPSA